MGYGTGHGLTWNGPRQFPLLTYPYQTRINYISDASYFTSKKLTHYIPIPRKIAMSTSLLQKPPKRRCRRRDPFKIVSFDVEGSSSSAKNDQVILPVKTVEQPLRPRQIKSRSGCEPCKRRHVKCDETQPICLRCQKSDITCTGIFKLDPWQIERPWLDSTHERVQTLEA